MPARVGNNVLFSVYGAGILNFAEKRQMFDCAIMSRLKIEHSQLDAGLIGRGLMS